MTKMKSTKRALIASFLVLVMCISMLVGSTFAWFTDSVTSSGNIIKSGKLEVSMMWADGKNDPATTAWTDAEAGAIFNNDLWEPGYTEVRHIKIENEGNLALKYQLTFTATGEYTKLAEVIDVYYVDPAQAIADRTDLANATLIGTLADVLANFQTTAAGALEEGENHTVTLALKMQETAGNAYQELAIGSDFCVVLMATQNNVEIDSFDKDYDIDADIPEMDIETINGVTYGKTNTGDYVMISVDDYTLTNHTVDNKVTILGTGNGINDNDRVFGKNAPLETLTLPEGLVEIKDNALNTLPSLTTVNFPSTLKTIGIQAFRITGMSTLTIPENVETIKKGAFRDMANLTTVTVEGNVAFDEYAFRNCPKLETIYLMGDDVTFNGGQFATHTDSGSCNSPIEHLSVCPGKLTIYVKNATVAARVIAAQGSAQDYVVKIMGEQGSDNVDVVTVKNATELQNALNATKDTTIVLNGNITGNVMLTQKEGIDILVEGNGKTFNGVFSVFGDARHTGTETFAIQNVNFVAANGADSCILSPDKGTHNPARYSYAHNVTVDNCTFTDPDGVVNCAAIRHGDGGDVNWVIKNCTVDSTMHSLVQVNNVKGNDGLVIEGCKVYSKNGINLNQCAKVSIIDCVVDTKGYAVRFGVNGATVNGDFEIKDSSLKSANDDGDAVIILRGTMTGSTLTLTNTTLVGTPEFTGTANIVRN